MECQASQGTRASNPLQRLKQSRKLEIPKYLQVNAEGGIEAEQIATLSDSTLTNVCLAETCCPNIKQNADRHMNNCGWLQITHISNAR